MPGVVKAPPGLGAPTFSNTPGGNYVVARVDVFSQPARGDSRTARGETSPCGKGYHPGIEREKNPSRPSSAAARTGACLLRPHAVPPGASEAETLGERRSVLTDRSWGWCGIRQRAGRPHPARPGLRGPSVAQWPACSLPGHPDREKAPEEMSRRGSPGWPTRPRSQPRKPR